MRDKDLTKRQDKRSKDTQIRILKSLNLHDFLAQNQVLLHVHLDFPKFYVGMMEDKLKNKGKKLSITKAYTEWVSTN